MNWNELTIWLSSLVVGLDYFVEVDLSLNLWVEPRLLAALDAILMSG